MNKELLENLEDRIQTNWNNKTSLIGDVFLRMAPFLKLYVQVRYLFPQYYCSLDRPIHSDIVISLPFLSQYIKYVNNYNLSNATIMKYNDNEKWKEFIQTTLSNPTVAKMGLKGLGNFLILPIQRVSRTPDYRLDY